MDLTFAVVGPGSVGSVLKRSLEAAGLIVSATMGRDDDLTTLPDATMAVAICTPDGNIASVAEALANALTFWDGKLVFHVSGALTSEVLAPLARRGAQVASFHPLSSYPPGPSERDMSGTTVAIEGDAQAVEKLSYVARRLNASPVVLSIRQKAAYHLAASMASNFLVTLTGNVQAVLEASGLSPNLMDSLIADTLSNLQSTPPSHALTGPIARGDIETVRLHLETLDSVSPGMIPWYRAMAHATVDSAFEAGRIDERQRRSLLAVVDSHGPEEP